MLWAAAVCGPTAPAAKPGIGSPLSLTGIRLENTGKAPCKDSPGNSAVLVDTDGQRFDAELVAETRAGPSFPGSVSISPDDSALGFSPVGEWSLTESPDAEG
ncbi:hypothetical protein AB0N81_37255 [Streptomyces sp. NPDC093510]|uniref:hypothetical protein n=1 Tax=Streptomyces sp. NPDC093510 TaxID=3155199 RepID=UPI00343EFCD3